MLGAAAAAFLVVVVAVIAVEMLLRDDLAMTMTTPYLGAYVNKYSIFLPKDPTEKVSYYVKLVLIPI